MLQNYICNVLDTLQTRLYIKSVILCHTNCKFYIVRVSRNSLEKYSKIGSLGIELKMKWKQFSYYGPLSPYSNLSYKFSKNPGVKTQCVPKYQTQYQTYNRYFCLMINFRWIHSHGKRLCHDHMFDMVDITLSYWRAMISSANFFRNLPG